MFISCLCNITSLSHDHKKDVQLASGSLTPVMIAFVLKDFRSFQFNELILKIVI